MEDKATKRIDLALARIAARSCDSLNDYSFRQSPNKLQIDFIGNCLNEESFRL